MFIIITTVPFPSFASEKRYSMLVKKAKTQPQSLINIPISYIKIQPKTMDQRDTLSGINPRKQKHARVKSDQLRYFAEIGVASCHEKLTMARNNS